jgi:hypothetical protein
MRTSVGAGYVVRGSASGMYTAQLRPTIHRSICPGDALSTIGAEECDHVGRIIGFTDSLERLHAECKIAAFLGTTAFT